VTGKSFGVQQCGDGEKEKGGSAARTKNGSGRQLSRSGYAFWFSKHGKDQEKN